MVAEISFSWSIITKLSHLSYQYTAILGVVIPGQKYEHSLACIVLLEAFS